MLIDVDIAPLIQDVWSKGIETSACCQGDDDQEAYISFKSLGHLRKFCNEYPTFKMCEFDVLNPFFVRNDLTKLTYKELDNYVEQYNDLFSVRFDHDILAHM